MKRLKKLLESFIRKIVAQMILDGDIKIIVANDCVVDDWYAVNGKKALLSVFGKTQSLEQGMFLQDMRRPSKPPYM